MAETTDWVAKAKYAVEHACYKIANAELLLYPSPHIYVSEVFPPDFYQKLIEYFPHPHAFNQMKNSMHGNHEISDKRFYLSYFDGDSRRLPEDHAEFWDALLSQLAGKQFYDTTHAKFARHLDIIRKLLLNSHQDLVLISDRTGYDIGPHTDTPQKQFSLLFYCPEDDKHPGVGTSLFRPKGTAPRKVRRTDSWFRLGGDTPLDFKDFEKIYSLPYLPNSLFGFVRTRHSYHGVEVTQDAGVTRQLLMYECFSTKKSRKLKKKHQSKA